MKNFEENLTEISPLNLAIYGSSKNDIPLIQREVDKIFSEYFFYPEMQWERFGYRAPEGHEVLGAWRNPSGEVFSFLLDNPKMLTVEPNIQLILHLVGRSNEIEKIVSKCDELKSKFSIKEERAKQKSDFDNRIKQVQRSKSLGTMTVLLAIFTGIINGFSLYLRKLPPPDFSITLLKVGFETLIALVHFMSLFLLCIMILILGIFLIKYGIMLIRKL